MNFDSIQDAERLRDFTTVSSEFYSQLQPHYDKVYEDWVAAKTASDREHEEEVPEPAEDENDPLLDPRHAAAVAALLKRAAAQLPGPSNLAGAIIRAAKLGDFRDYVRDELRRTGTLPTGEREVPRFGRFRFP